MVQYYALARNGACVGFLTEGQHANFPNPPPEGITVVPFQVPTGTGMEDVIAAAEAAIAAA